jgi:hypothetical protein
MVTILLLMEIPTSTSSNQSLYGDPDSCSVNRIQAAAVRTATPTTPSSRGQDQQGDWHEKSGVERGCLDGDRQMQCEPRMGGDCERL